MSNNVNSLRNNWHRLILIIAFLIAIVFMLTMIGCEGINHGKVLYERTYKDGTIKKISTAEIDVCAASNEGYHTFIFYEDGHIRELYGAWKPINKTSLKIKKIKVNPKWELPFTIVDFNGGEDVVQYELDKKVEEEEIEIVEEEEIQGNGNSVSIKRVALKIVKKEDLSKGELEVYRSNESKVDALINDYKRLQGKIEKTLWGE